MHKNSKSDRPSLSGGDLILIEQPSNAGQLQGNVNLSPRNAIGPEGKRNGELNQFFVCQICLKVILDPKECIKCQTAFCAGCIDKWVGQSPLENNSSCPLRCTDTRFQPIHRFAKQELLAQKFACPYVDSEDDDPKCL